MKVAYTKYEAEKMIEAAILEVQKVKIIDAIHRRILNEYCHNCSKQPCQCHLKPMDI